MNCINAATLNLGMEQLQGHDLHIGVTLEYFPWRPSFKAVKAIGRWSSGVFIGYLRQHTNILTPYFQGMPVFTEFHRFIMPPPS